MNIQSARAATFFPAKPATFFYCELGQVKRRLMKEIQTYIQTLIMVL